MDPAVVVPFPVATERRSRLTKLLRISQESRDLSVFVARADERLGRTDAGDAFDRAAIAVRLGDPVDVALMHEHAALAIIASVHERIRKGEISREHPLTHVNLTTWRELAKISVTGAHDFLTARRG